ncbi:hypothetical protein AVEN_241881-1 [Araneus ventricosus]|uniref:Uncharacterized protein n=1 Tax=Araneus ventricosus TaxID=182803 RepID=A0A4Y2NS63_ARAVE|nr:hypothetical protein AVEN_241881-1 [Araneus ventricosus]
MMRTTPELAPPLQASTPHQREAFGSDGFKVLQARSHGGSSGSIRVSSLKPYDPEVKTLPPDQSGLMLLYSSYIIFNKIEEKFSEIYANHVSKTDIAENNVR